MGVRTHRLVLVSCFLLVLLSNSPVQGGQITLDHSLGQSGRALPGPNFKLSADQGQAHGNNLFFSFSEFSLSSGETATFAGPAHIQNILSRVTGGSQSSIDGTIRSEIVGANLFLMNPSGIIFGPNAAVNVTGSFAATTANYLKLADGARFAAALGLIQA
jgi:filamentous hemagglutinin family protein